MEDLNSSNMAPDPPKKFCWSHFQNNFWSMPTAPSAWSDFPSLPESGGVGGGEWVSGWVGLQLKEQEGGVTLVGGAFFSDPIPYSFWG